MTEEFKMVEECASIFEVREVGDEVEIHIRVEQRFRDLWIVKLNRLTATLDEIAYYESDD